MSDIIRNKKIITFLYLGIIAIILLCAFLFSVKGKKEDVAIVLNGNEYYKLSLNNDYVDEGFSIKINNKEIDLENVDYKIKENVNKEVIGQYEVDYEINYDDKIYKAKRYVEVVDDVKPDIIVNQDYVAKYYCKKKDKLNIDYQAEDNYDGIITDKVVVDVKDDHVSLSVKDSAGNESKKEVPIKIINDEDAAIITLNGKELIYLAVGDEYKEEGASLTDGCGKDSNESLNISGTVDTSTPGEYLIKYSYVSASGLETIKNRKVIVYEKHSNTHNVNEERVIYLTFDDGPGMYTEELLDILKKYDVKATFFVTNQFKKYTHLIKREYEEGHAIGVHSLTHKWNIYRSVATYVKDFNDMNQIIYDYTGERVSIFRFPGGSSNTVSKKYSTGVVKAIASKMSKNGYVYFDWNVDSEDAAGANSEKIINNVINGINSRKSSVILMHDIKRSTVSSIETIIKYALDNGYTFKTLMVNSQTCHHSINN